MKRVARVYVPMVPGLQPAKSAPFYTGNRAEHVMRARLTAYRAAAEAKLRARMRKKAK